MAVTYQELLNVPFFVPEVTRLLHNNVGGLRNVVNNKGIVVGNEIRFPKASTDGIAKEVNPGSPVIAESLVATRVAARITPYEASCTVYQQDLNASNSAAEIRSLAAEKVVSSAENRYSKTILDALSEYDSANMEVGGAAAHFDVNMLIDLNTMATRNYWGQNDRYLILPPQAQATLMKDQKFYEQWSAFYGKRVAERGAKATADSNEMLWTPYMGFNIAFMGNAGDNTVVGLPTAADGSAMGFAFLGSRVGFGMNRDMEVSIDRLPQLEGTPLLFKANSSCGATIIDPKAVIGIKVDAQY